MGRVNATLVELVTAAHRERQLGWLGGCGRAGQPAVSIWPAGTGCVRVRAVYDQDGLARLADQPGNRGAGDVGRWPAAPSLLSHWFSRIIGHDSVTALLGWPAYCRGHPVCQFRAAQGPVRAQFIG